MITINYSIIRYVPDIFRRECINIGAIVVAPVVQMMKYKIVDADFRIKHFYPAYDKDEIQTFINHLERIRKAGSIEVINPTNYEVSDINIYTKEYLDDMYRKFLGNNVQITTPYWTDFDAEKINEETINTFLNDLISKYVQVPSAPKLLSEKVTQLKTKIREEFIRRKLLSTDNEIKKHRIVTNYQLPKFDWKYDFALKNRRLHLIETLDLSKRSIESPYESMKEAAMTYMKFSGAQSKLGKKSIHNITILNAESSKEKEIKRELDLIEDVSEVFNFKSTSDRRKLFDELEKAIGMQSFTYR